MKKSRIEFNNKSADRAFEVLKNWGNPFENRDSLVNICSGVEATQEIKHDVINARNIGESELNKFWTDRIQANKDFYAPLKKMKLKSFGSLKVKKTIKLKEKSVVIAAERGLFARLLTIAQTTSGLTLKQILSYSLSPIPWALGLPDGGYVKTNKAKLLSKYNLV